MYSFAQRADTRVVDEPFYGYYLARSGADHPGRADVLAALPHDPDDVFALLDRRDTRPLLFVKGMAHHLAGIDPERLCAMTSLFLIRDPRHLIASFAQVLPQPTMADVGVRAQSELFDALRARGAPAVVLDSGDLVRQPETVLPAACAALDIAFDTAMLSWPPGPREEDGVWAPYWYGSVHRSTSFRPRRDSSRPLPDHCAALAAEAMPLYRRLRQFAVSA